MTIAKPGKPGPIIATVQRVGGGFPVIRLTEMGKQSFRLEVEGPKATRRIRGSYVSSGTVSSGPVHIRAGGTQLAGDLSLQPHSGTLTIGRGSEDLEATSNVLGVDDVLAISAMGFLLACGALVIVAAYGGSTELVLSGEGFEIKVTLETPGAAGGGGSSEDEADENNETDENKEDGEEGGESSEESNESA